MYSENNPFCNIFPLGLLSCICVNSLARVIYNICFHRYFFYWTVLAKNKTSSVRFYQNDSSQDDFTLK